ncbi:hypothetical protein GFS03_04085 [Sulfolobus sp. E5-1-F]|uniref:hypothetical protein n=1 Tax=Saccharolobus sp. E5-1-F TaxID=2663019 RepID=UPI0012959EEB|nr:hypothetical protein [Sulfolobus sp. E5-1-F]QGA53819.1 hypothetical protein GFS03_04085 [Sulfolobus sp. E5-1-F]
MSMQTEVRSKGTIISPQLNFIKPNYQNPSPSTNIPIFYVYNIGSPISLSQEFDVTIPRHSVINFDKKLISLSHEFGISDKDVISILIMFLHTVESACKKYNCEISDLGYDNDGIYIFIKRCNNNKWDKIIEVVDIKYIALLNQFGKKAEDARGVLGIICEDGINE